MSLQVEYGVYADGRWLIANGPMEAKLMADRWDGTRIGTRVVSYGPWVEGNNVTNEPPTHWEAEAAIADDLIAVDLGLKPLPAGLLAEAAKAIFKAVSAAIALRSRQDTGEVA